MWKKCFNDSDDFLDLHFSRKYKHENTLIYFEGDQAAASLQMFSYNIRFWGEIVPFYYLAGLCTLPEYRKKGYMAQLIHESHSVMLRRKIPLSILVPAENWLYGFYEKFGYEQVFEGNENIVPLKEILDMFPSISKAYSYFDSSIQNKDFYVQKSLDEFTIIVDESKMDGFPVKYNLSAMARVIDSNFLFNIYNKKALSFLKQPISSIEITDEHKVFTYLPERNEKSIDLKTDLRMLARLLFGYKTSILSEPLNILFPEHHPTINLMLE